MSVESLWLLVGVVGLALVWLTKGIGRSLDAALPRSPK